MAPGVLIRTWTGTTDSRASRVDAGCVSSVSSDERSACVGPGTRRSRTLPEKGHPVPTSQGLLLDHCSTLSSFVIPVEVPGSV